MSAKALVVIGKSPVIEKVESREGGVISGDPVTNVWKYADHSSGKMKAGIWDCQAGKWNIESHPNDELCVIIEGAVAIKDETGASYVFKPGDAFMLSEGMKTQWTVKEYVKKIFMVVNGL